MKKTLLTRRRYGSALLLVFLTGLPAAGCGKPKGTVSGQVTYQGKPLKTGFVTFTPENGPAVNSPIDGEGKYSARNVPAGTAKISVRSEAGTSRESFDQIKNPKDPRQIKNALMPKATGQRIPQIYNDPEKSGLTYTVQQGPQEHNIDLK